VSSGGPVFVSAQDLQHKKLYRDARRKLTQILDELLAPPHQPPSPAESGALQ